MSTYSVGGLAEVSFILLISTPLGDPKKASIKIGDQQRGPYFFWGILVFLLGLFIFMAHADFLSEKDGETVLAPWRKAKMMKELEDMEYGEQYVLIAKIPGYYPCYSCKHKKEIYLNVSEVWKYGVTSKGEQGRYKGGLPVPGLVYLEEYIGNLHECYKREKIQIYNYALLPENLKREERLIRPPGNKQDN